MSSAFSERELSIIRHAYAKQILAQTGTSDPALESAIALVKRENYLGPGPWPMFRGPKGYAPSPSDDPVYLYTNDLVGLIPEKGLNNGQPAFLCFLIGQSLIRPGEHVVHVGAGVGYYTAIMAQLVGPEGRVVAIEYEESLAERALANFASQPNVKVIKGDGTIVPFDKSDVIFVNAGASKPVDHWLDRMRDSGRLILMLTTAHNFTASARPATAPTPGGVFRITREGNEYGAKLISAVGVFPCVGARDEASEAALAAGFAKGGAERVTRLYRTDDIPEERSWAKAPGWCLAYS